MHHPDHSSSLELFFFFFFFNMANTKGDFQREICSSTSLYLKEKRLKINELIVLIRKRRAN